MDEQNRHIVCEGSLPLDISAVQSSSDDTAYLAYSTSSQTDEKVHLAQLKPEGLVDLGAWPGFRPAICIWGGAVACAYIEGAGVERSGSEGFFSTLKPKLIINAEAEQARVPLPIDANQSASCHQVSLASFGDQLYLAWSEQRADCEAQIQLRRFGMDGTGETLTPLKGTSVDLAVAEHALIALTTGTEGVHLHRLTGSSFTTQQLYKECRCEAPQVLSMANGSLYACWHAPIGDGVLRWPQLAIIDDDGVHFRQPPGAQAHSTRAQIDAGVNQGWEWPVLTSDSKGGVWIAGRSSQGYRAQHYYQGNWSDRIDLTSPKWGSRGRTGALLQQDHTMTFLFGAPEGFVSTKLANKGAVTQEGANDDNAIKSCPPPARKYAANNDWPWASPIFGDPHQHTIHSDGMGSVEDALWRARHVYGHDFTAITDHELFTKKAIGPLTWKAQCDLVDAHYQPGTFATLHAYEFTGSREPGPGHKCVYFGSSYPDSLPPKDPDALKTLLSHHGAFAVPHHIGWTGADYPHHNDTLQPVWEICSTHGAYEYQGNQPISPRDDVVLPGHFIHDALGRGLMFGFVGGSDNHGLRWHHGVSRKPDPQRCGLTAVFSNITREGIIGALKQRQCYATSGARILLHVDVDGATMGSKLDARPKTFVAEALGTTIIDRMTLIIDGEEVAHTGGGSHKLLRYDLGQIPTRSHHYGYVRVLQRDGEMAWSSPVCFPD